jgi:hypothetical protein
LAEAACAPSSPKKPRKDAGFGGDSTHHYKVSPNEMGTIFVVFETNERLRNLQGNFKDVVDFSIIAAFGEL